MVKHISTLHFSTTKNVNVSLIENLRLAETSPVLLFRAQRESSTSYNKNKSKNQFFGCQAPGSSGGLSQRESNGPGIALSEHEAELHFMNLRDILKAACCGESCCPGIALSGHEAKLHFIRLRLFSKNFSSDARHAFCRSARCGGNPTAPGLL